MSFATDESWPRSIKYCAYIYGVKTGIIKDEVLVNTGRYMIFAWPSPANRVVV